MPTPSFDRDDFVDFLHWLAHENFVDADYIISVVDEPWRYEAEYAEYLAAGGLDR